MGDSMRFSLRKMPEQVGEWRFPSYDFCPVSPVGARLMHGFSFGEFA